MDASKNGVLPPDPEDQLDTVGRLAGALAHEIRNPLTAIDMHITLLAETLVDSDLSNPQRVERFLSIIRSEIRRLGEVLDHYTGFTRTREVHAEQVDLALELQELHDLMSPHAQAAGLEFQVGLAGGVESVLADRIQLRQALLNLVLNALQATDEGGSVEILADREPESDRLRVTVRDTGIGITAEVLPRVFELFFTTKASGAGLGLSLVRQIMVDHGGAVTAESQPDVGSTFTLLFPT